jgi:hypothetical protein
MTLDDKVRELTAALRWIAEGFDNDECLCSPDEYDDYESHQAYCANYVRGYVDAKLQEIAALPVAVTLESLQAKAARAGFWMRYSSPSGRGDPHWIELMPLGSVAWTEPLESLDLQAVVDQARKWLDERAPTDKDDA